MSFGDRPICKTYEQWQVDDLIAQRDELAAALKDALQTADFERHAQRPWHFAARAALAKVNK